MNRNLGLINCEVEYNSVKNIPSKNTILPKAIEVLFAQLNPKIPNNTKAENEFLQCTKAYDQ